LTLFQDLGGWEEERIKENEVEGEFKYDIFETL
jgi:hypothetical protein